MAMGDWEDFTSKYGFGDGNRLECCDEVARDVLVRLLNEHPEMVAAGIRTEAFDRPGVHNSCLILLYRGQELVADLPEAVDSDIDVLIQQAYALAGEANVDDYIDDEDDEEGE